MQEIETPQPPRKPPLTSTADIPLTLEGIVDAIIANLAGLADVREGTPSLQRSVELAVAQMVTAEQGPVADEEGGAHKGEDWTEQKLQAAAIKSFLLRPEDPDQLLQLSKVHTKLTFVDAQAATQQHAMLVQISHLLLFQITFHVEIACALLSRVNATACHVKSSTCAPVHVWHARAQLDCSFHSRPIMQSPGIPQDNCRCWFPSAYLTRTDMLQGTCLGGNQSPELDGRLVGKPSWCTLVMAACAPSGAPVLRQTILILLLYFADTPGSAQPWYL
jgi:hypothetical protein